MVRNCGKTGKLELGWQLADWKDPKRCYKQFSWFLLSLDFRIIESFGSKTGKNDYMIKWNKSIILTEFIILIKDKQKLNFNWNFSECLNQSCWNIFDLEFKINKIFKFLSYHTLLHELQLFSLNKFQVICRVIVTNFTWSGMRVFHPQISRDFDSFLNSL